MRSEAIEAIGAGKVCLRIEFIRHGDRFAQFISVIDAAGNAIPALESIEGTSKDEWPTSPPLQSLSIETLPDGRRAALLVGMAGGSHWSASVEPIAGEAALLFDIACRHSKAPIHLGSCYRRLRAGERQVAIVAEGASFVERQDSVEICPAVAATTAGMTRWKFSVLGPEY